MAGITPRTAGSWCPNSQSLNGILVTVIINHSNNRRIMMMDDDNSPIVLGAAQTQQRGGLGTCGGESRAIEAGAGGLWGDSGHFCVRRSWSLCFREDLGFKVT